MRTRLVILSALTLLGASLLTLAQSPSAAARLNQAKQTETKRGLEAAIGEYENILKDYPNDRSTGAIAIARIVRLYEIMEKPDEMREACRRLRSGYENQPEVPAEVRDLCRPKPRTRPGIFIAKMDAQSGVIQEVRSVTEDPNRQETHPSLSPNGRFLAFRRAVGTPQGSAVIVRSLPDKTEYTMRACSNTSNNFGRQMWLPDSRSVVSVHPVENLACVGVNDSQSGELLRSFNAGGLISLWSALSPDGKTMHTLVPTTLLGAATASLVALDLESGTPTRAFIMPFLPFLPGVTTSSHILALSPDGRTAASLRASATPSARLDLLDTDGDARHYRELFVAGTQMKGVAWSSDGKRIFFAVSADGSKWRIMQIPAEGGPASFTGLEVDDLQYFELNRDNTEIVFDGLSGIVSAPGPYTPPPPPVAPPAAPASTPPAGRDGARGARG